MTFRDLNDKESAMQRIWVKSVPGRGNNSCKSPKAIANSPCPRNRKKVSEAEGQCAGGREYKMRSEREHVLASTEAHRPG